MNCGPNIVVILYVFASCVALGQCANYWTWTCADNKCVKERLTENQEATSFEVCELLCYDYSRIWPMPRGNFQIERKAAIIKLGPGYSVSPSAPELLDSIFERFSHLPTIYNDHPPGISHLKGPKVDATKIHFDITNVEVSTLELNVDESYELKIEQKNGNVQINIKAANVFGARHALETLSQVIVYDTVHSVYVVPALLVVEDSPIYTVRGVMIDTARNYLSVATIKRILEGMAVNKLNTLHWHLTDSQSFPFVSTSLPQLSELGAYSAKKVFTRDDIKELVTWAQRRGVRIIPEFDGPAHVGEGWQNTDLVVCFGKQPWGSYCSEPPCGQFDPTKNELYSTLKLLYKDLIAAFDPVAFHFGGDEVNFNCWRSAPSIRDWLTAHNHSWLFDSGYVTLWDMYQNRSYNTFMQERQKEVPAILWTSTLTDKEHLHHLPNDKYIIHVWTTGRDSTIGNLLKNDYKIIVSNYDALYLDCGFQSWVSSAASNNWCSPYITWQKMYGNSPAKIVQNFGEEANKPRLMMGSIAPLWSETVDDASAENRIWPRASALAERAWAEPKTPAGDWSKVIARLDSHRGRMLKLGINADTLIPGWCHANQDSCN